MAHRRLGAFYARSFERRPWLTLAIANGTLGALADVLAQTFERINGERQSSRTSSSSSSTKTGNGEAAIAQAQKNDEHAWNVARTSRFFAFGVAMAPLLDKWNRFIEHRFPLRVSGGVAGASTAAKVSVQALAKRVAVDQIVFAPFGLVCFVGAMGLMEGRDSASLQQKFQEMYMPALLANWKVWPLVQTINFRFMPLRFRVPFTGAIGIAWQVFLSILNASRSKSDQNSSNTAAQPQAIAQST